MSVKIYLKDRGIFEVSRIVPLVEQFNAFNGVVNYQRDRYNPVSGMKPTALLFVGDIDTRVSAFVPPLESNNQFIIGNLPEEMVGSIMLESLDGVINLSDMYLKELASYESPDGLGEDYPIYLSKVTLGNSGLFATNINTTVFCTEIGSDEAMFIATPPGQEVTPEDFWGNFDEEVDAEDCVFSERDEYDEDDE